MSTPTPARPPVPTPSTPPGSDNPTPEPTISTPPTPAETTAEMDLRKVVAYAQEIGRRPGRDGVMTLLGEDGRRAGTKRASRALRAFDALSGRNLEEVGPTPQAPDPSTSPTPAEGSAEGRPDPSILRLPTPHKPDPPTPDPLTEAPPTPQGSEGPTTPDPTEDTRPLNPTPEGSTPPDLGSGNSTPPSYSPTPQGSDPSRPLDSRPPAGRTDTDVPTFPTPRGPGPTPQDVTVNPTPLADPLPGVGPTPEVPDPREGVGPTPEGAPGSDPTPSRSRALRWRGRPDPSSPTSPTPIEGSDPTSPTPDPSPGVGPTPRKKKRPAPTPEEKAARKGTFGYYLVAAMSLGVSADTSLLFFKNVLMIENLWEQMALFSVMEVMLVASAIHMRADVRYRGMASPRAATKIAVWGMAAFAAYAAYEAAGANVPSAIGRVVLGPLIGLFALHAALGIEIRAHRSGTTTWDRVRFELRERALSYLGLGDDQRTALARRRERFARRAAHLAALPRPRWSFRRNFRAGRIRRALRAANVAHDPAMCDVLRAELGLLQGASRLHEIEMDAPWSAADPAEK